MRGKVAEIKRFVYPLLALWKAFMNPALKVRKQIRLMLEANAHLEDLLTEYEQDVAFPPPVADDFENTCCTMLCLHGQVWCFIGEDFQMKIQKLAMASMKGNNPPSAAQKMMRHYRLAMDLLCRQLREGAMLEEED
eukprot:s6015_g4.t2